MPLVSCPCHRGPYESCCKPFHLGLSLAGSAEALMRSRYSAYALGLSNYVLSTWHPSTRPAQLDLQDEVEQGKWLGLQVMAQVEEGNTATVEFVARYKPKSAAASRLHERSRFVKEEGRWWYVDGDLLD